MPRTFKASACLLAVQALRKPRKASKRNNQVLAFTAHSECTYSVALLTMLYNAEKTSVVLMLDKSACFSHGAGITSDHVHQVLHFYGIQLSQIVLVQGKVYFASSLIRAPLLDGHPVISLGRSYLCQMQPQSATAIHTAQTNGPPLESTVPCSFPSICCIPMFGQLSAALDESPSPLPSLARGGRSTEEE